MSKHYWTYAFSTAVYLINRLPSSVLNTDTPYHKLFGVQPNYTKLRVYECLCFPWLRPYTSHKLEDRSTPCVFLGYSQTQSSYLCLQPRSGRIYISRHVRFDENVFPFSPTILPKPTSNTTQNEPIILPLVTKINLNPPRPPLVMPPSGSSSSDSNLQVQQKTPTETSPFQATTSMSTTPSSPTTTPPQQSTSPTTPTSTTTTSSSSSPSPLPAQPSQAPPPPISTPCSHVARIRSPSQIVNTTIRRLSQVEFQQNQTLCFKL